MAPKHQSSDAGNLDTTKRSSERVKVLDLIRKRKKRMLRLQKSMERMNLLSLKLPNLQIKLYHGYAGIEKT